MNMIHDNRLVGRSLDCINELPHRKVWPKLWVLLEYVRYVRDILENITNIDSLVEVFEPGDGGAEFFVEALVTGEVIAF